MGARFDNHLYINDGFVYQNYVLDGSGRHVRVSDLWERWTARHPNAKNPITELTGFDDGFVKTNVLDVVVAGDKSLYLVTTARNRKQYITESNQMLTTEGYKPLSGLGIGAELITMDNYKGYYGDTVALGTTGNHRLRAILRNHGVPFKEIHDGGTLVNDKQVFVVEYDTTGPIRHGNTYTLGLNNYREYIESELDLTKWSTDAIVRIVPTPSHRRYVLGVYVDGPQNIAMTNGIILRSTQTEVMR